MTGLDCLREEMRKRGCNKAQVESKTVAVVLDILSESGDINTRRVDEEMKVADLQRHAAALQMKVTSLQEEYAKEYRILHRKQDAFDSQLQKAREYINQFLEAMNNCETPEARDNMKKAQMFVNSVSVETKYDNTAYIIGLASILSNGACAAIPELKKINKKIFDSFS